MNKFVKFCEDKTKLNLTIDIILFFLLMAMAGLGFLIKYTLIPGEKHNAIYSNNIDLELLGMDRHQWGTVHLILSIAFVIFIMLHIIFHWKMIIVFFKRLIPNRIIRVLFSIFISVVGLFLFVFGFVVNPEQVKHDNLYRHRTVGVPGSYICNELGIPTHCQSEKLGRLRKNYNFSMSDVSRAIAKYKNIKIQ